MASWLARISKSKWLMLTLYAIMITGNGILAKTVHYSTDQLQKYLQLNYRELQGITVSATYLLSIPLSLFGSYIVTVFGIPETIVILQLVSLFGWVTFADGVYRKSKYLNIAGRLIEGGALGAKRVPVILYCTCRFKKTNLAFALGCLSMAHRLSMVIGPLLIINLFMERWRMADSLPMLYWSATVFLIPGTVLSILVWLCNRYHYSHKALAVRNASTENKSNSIDATQTSS
eukprot:216392_1